MSGDEEDVRDAQSSERSEVFGSIDAGALRRIRDVFVEVEPLVEAASLDDPLNPQTVAVEFSDGVGDASSSRLDVRWSLSGSYAVHHTDDRERNFRFDRHPKPDAPTRHFHPPPDAPSRPVEPSRIAVTEVELVVRAVLSRWRYAYDQGAFVGVNDAANPP